MIAYWTMYLLALLPERRQLTNSGLFWGFVFVLLTLLIGYRFEVGCDWWAYKMWYMRAQYSLESSLSMGDPGYTVMNWFAGALGGDYHLANLFSAGIFTFGLLYFVRRQPAPILALAVAIPYTIIVVGMGYTRQGIALAFLMIALTRLGKGRNISFFLIVLVGALFHKTVAVLLPLGLISVAQDRGLMKWFVFGFAAWMGSFLVLDSAEQLWQNYVEADMQSQGALIRVAMNGVAAGAFLIFRKRWKRAFDDEYLYFWFAMAALACIPMLSITSTAVDRMALYILPLQIAVFSRIPLLVGKGNRTLMSVGVVAGYALVLGVWLNYAAHSRCWIPYQNVLFQ